MKVSHCPTWELTAARLIRGAVPVPGTSGRDERRLRHIHPADRQPPPHPPPHGPPGTRPSRQAAAPQTGNPASTRYRPHRLSAPSRCPGQTRRPAPHRLGDLDHRGRPARLRRLTRGDQGLHPKPPSCRAARTAQRLDHDERPGPATTPGLTPHTEPGPRTPFTAAMAPRQRRARKAREPPGTRSPSMSGGTGTARLA
jgi:hypothetical protein